LPPGIVGWGDGLGPRTMWSALVLPFLDETALYNAYNSSVRAWLGANTTATYSVLSQYLCPSDASPAGGSTYGESSYAANCGTISRNSFCCGEYASQAVPASVGPMYCCSRTRMRDIRDGTSNTIAVTEGAKVMTGTGTVSTTRMRWGYRVYYRAFRDSVYPMNSVLHDRNGGENDFRVASVHEGGAFFLFCDGQVRFLSENIDMGTYRALSSIANNEIVDDEDY
jgi:uncharacterized protein DUF1559